MEDLKKLLNRRCTQECSEITIFLNSKSEGITGRLIDIFDNEVVKLENEKAEKFLIPWDLVSFIEVMSNKPQKTNINHKEKS